MKRTALAVAFLISFCMNSHAQKFTFGPSVKAGISEIIFIKTDTIQDHTFNNRLNFSFQAGAFANYQFAQRFSVGLELLYWLQNGKLKDQFIYYDPVKNKNINQTDVYKAHLSYFTVPIFFQYYLSDVILLLGGQGGLVFSQTGSMQTTTIVDDVTTEGEKTSRTPNLEDVDVGFKAGVLYKISQNITAGVEYYNGRINLSRNNDDPFSSRNQYFYGSFRYNLIRGKRGQIYYN